jgi:dienelactone hydrolase
MAALKRWLVGALACAAAAAAAAARADDLLAALREEVVMVPAAVASLETTLFRPAGNGPFRLVVVNHGKAAGEPRRQPRARYLALAHELVQRGYAVVVPMRRGFAQSGGDYAAHPCDARAHGMAQADDVRAALDFYSRRADIDASRVVVIGQSAGGLTALALGAQRVPAVAGLVNFAGGLREDGCADWEGGLAQAFGAYGEASRVPSLWFYGDNDAHFAPRVWQDLYRAYTAHGGRATLVAHGRFGDDAHELAERRAGAAVWLPAMERFFGDLGLPFERQRDIALAAHEAAPPAATRFAVLGDAASVPALRGAGIEAYAQFLKAGRPRAFAVAEDGSWSWYSGTGDAMTRALAYCGEHAGAPCRLYAVDDTVVWMPH